MSHPEFLSHFEEFSYDLISRREMTRVLSFENTELPSFSESSKCVVRNEDNNFNDFFNIAFKIPQLISSSFYWVKLLHCIVPKVVRSSLPHCSTGSIVHTSSIPMVGQKSKTSKPANFHLVFPHNFAIKAFVLFSNVDCCWCESLFSKFVYFGRCHLFFRCFSIEMKVVE